MEILTIVLTGLGLSMDAFAVSVSNGICYREVSKQKSLFMAFVFGFFQALMPFVGYFLGSAFSGFIEKIDHYIAFILLAMIGSKFIVDAIKEIKYPHCCIVKETFSTKELLIQGIATSIDALIIGVTFAVVGVNIYIAVAIIGLITFFVCAQGVRIGKKFGSIAKNNATIIGGAILIIIGFKILVEHLFF